MPEWTREFNSTFFLAVGSLTSASFALVLRYLIKSKCRRFSCCGLVVDRDVDAELKSEEMELAAKKHTEPPLINGGSTKHPSPDEKV